VGVIGEILYRRTLHLGKGQGEHMPSLKSLWEFSRPHTIIGTVLSLFGVYFIALGSIGAIDFSNLMGLLIALLACLCGNVYIVGLNQIFDVDIDKINKPYLPLASGELSAFQARSIVTILGFLALVIAWTMNFYLGLTVFVSLIIGTAYSLPPIRLKRFPLFASLCIFTVRGLIVNLGLFLYFKNLLGEPIGFTVDILCMAVFITIFTVVIAIFKDIPDMEGDRKYRIKTLSLHLGKKSVFQLSLAILSLNYAAVIGLALFFPNLGNPALLIIPHLGLMGWLWFRAQQVDLESTGAIYDFYQFIWKLFYAEYLVLPLAFLLG
jgi:homogentisate phytyltransferase / homogentisate geranylgeranyltransferase